MKTPREWLGTLDEEYTLGFIRAVQLDVIEECAKLAEERAVALHSLGGVHLREAVGIGETAMLIRALKEPK